MKVAESPRQDRKATIREPAEAIGPASPDNYGRQVMNGKRTLWVLGICCTFLTSGLTSSTATAGALSGNCRVSDQPAATLLIPYFEVDLAHPGGATTLMSVNNASSKPAIARVVMWTDWGVPT